MTYKTNELYSSVDRDPDLRCEPSHMQVKTFAPVSGGGTLTALTPVAFKITTGKWVVWSGDASVEEVQTITIDATGGTFALTFEGATLATPAWNITAAALLTAMEGLPAIRPGDITVTLDTLVYTITFLKAGDWGDQDVPIITTDATNLTGGGGTAVVAVDEAGVAGDGVDVISAFVWSDSIVLDDSAVGNEDVQGHVVMAGRIHYDDIVLPSGETQSVLDAALQSGPREKGLFIYGLEGVN
jgi:hypothetical protein